MKTNYFKDDDIMSFYWGKKKEVESSMELKNINVLLDFNKDGDIIGIEIDKFGEVVRKSAKEVNEIFKLAEQSRQKEKKIKRRKV